MIDTNYDFKEENMNTRKLMQDDKNGLIKIYNNGDTNKKVFEIIKVEVDIRENNETLKSDRFKYVPRDKYLLSLRLTNVLDVMFDYEYGRDKEIDLSWLLFESGRINCLDILEEYGYIKYIYTDYEHYCSVIGDYVPLVDNIVLTSKAKKLKKFYDLE